MSHAILANRSPFIFKGFVRVNCDPVPPHRRGLIKHDDQLVQYFVGRVTGKNSRGVDFGVELAPGQELKLDVAGSAPALSLMTAPLPSDVAGWFGGVPMVNGAPFAAPIIQVDGVGFRLTHLMRLGNTFILKLFTHWIPTQFWCRSELTVHSASTSSPLLTELLPTLVLSWGDATVLVPGLSIASQPGALVTPNDEIIADGQGRAVPITFVWQRHMPADSLIAEDTVNAVANLAVSGIGVDVMYPGLGNPYTPLDLDPQRWRDARLSEAVRRLHTWEGAVEGPNKRSGDTGGQADQLFKGAEALLPNGVGAEVISYLSTLKMLGGRPCHFYEQGGAPVDVANHPGYAAWDGRPYLHQPDWLGKPRGLGWSEAHDWGGPDVEHNLNNRTAASCRLIDSDACQEELKHQALTYLAMYRVDEPALPWHCGPNAARATCYEGLLVYYCANNLADRSLAERVMQRGRDRIQKVIVPAYVNAPGSVWDWRRDDRLGPGMRWMPWQQAAGVFGLDLMSELLQIPEGRKVAHAGAQAVLRDAAVKLDGYWTFRDVVAADGSALSTGYYDWFAIPLAPATVLRNNPWDEKAQSIWSQYMVAAINTQDFAWLCPGLGEAIRLTPRKVSRNICRSFVKS